MIQTPFIHDYVHFLVKMSFQQLTTLLEALDLLKEGAKQNREADKAKKANTTKFAYNTYDKIQGFLRKAQAQAHAQLQDPLELIQVAHYLRTCGMKFSTDAFSLEQGFKSTQLKSKSLQKIRDILATGTCKEIEALKSDPTFWCCRNLQRCPDIGPVKAQQLMDAHGITSLEHLRTVAQDQPDLLTRAQHIGLRHLEDLETRIPYTEMEVWNTLMHLSAEAIGCSPRDTCMVGSFRRRATTCGDVDFYIAVDSTTKDQPKPYGNCIPRMIESLHTQGILAKEDIISQGPKKLMCVGRIQETTPFRHIDVFVHTRDVFPFAILHSTGSKDFNVDMRKHALQLGWSLSERGLAQGTRGGPPPTQEDIQTRIGKNTIETEADIFDFLGVHYVPPHKRQGGVLTIKS